MATNATERLPNHADALEIIDELKGIKNALVSANEADSDLTFSKLANQTKLNAVEALTPIGTKLSVSRTSAITVAMDNIDVSTKLSSGNAASCTVSVNDLTVFNSIFGATGATALQCYYDGTNWRDFDNDTIVDLTSEGASISGTPATGDRATLTRTAASFNMEVADYDHYTPVNSSITHLTTLTAEDCVHAGLQFDAPEMTWGATIAALPAGKYKFTGVNMMDSGSSADATYVFTTTQAIPLNGGWRHGTIGAYNASATSATIVAGTITTYAADRSTVVESGIAVSVYDADSDSDAVDLGYACREYSSSYSGISAYGMFNFTRRSAYGSGDYATSAIRQWLNSNKSKGNWWSPTSAFDLKPGYATTENGFLYGCDDDFVDNMQEAEINYYMQDSDYNLMSAQSASKPLAFYGVGDYSISGRVVTCKDKVFLLSVKEVNLGNNYNDNSAGNTVLDLYDGAANADRIKYFGTSAKYWWLRSPIPGYALNAARMGPDGTLGNDNAYSTFAVVPACNIG